MKIGGHWQTFTGSIAGHGTLAGGFGTVGGILSIAFVFHGLGRLHGGGSMLHERLEPLNGGDTGVLAGDLLHRPYRNVSHHVTKIARVCGYVGGAGSIGGP